MTPEKRKTAIKWLQEEIRSLRMAPKINGCGPENWADLLEIMETSLEAVRECDQNATEMRPGCNLGEPLNLEQLRGMDGQPVWVEPLGDEDWEPHWDVMKFNRISANSETVRGRMYFLYEGSYGTRWLAYAYPPARIDREVWMAEWRNHYRSGATAGTAGEGQDDPHGAVHRDRPAGVSAGRENAAGGH